MSEFSPTRRPPGADRPLIVALATPPGRAALAVVRWSGAGLDEHLRQLLPRCRALPPYRHAALVAVEDERGVVDEGILVRYERGRSYTGEASAELSLHGSPAVVRRVLAAALRRGAALASPGEFTRRAYLSGRLGLTQAEAVGELIAAPSRRGADAAGARLRGGRAEARLAAWRERLLRLLASVDEAIDVGGGDASAPEAELREALAELEREMSAAVPVAEERGVPKVVLVGRANAGKSTIFNRLVGEERALVTATPGTTRDPLRELLDLAGEEVLLVDTAGDGGEGGELGGLAEERAAQEEAGADVRLVVVGPFEGSIGERLQKGRERLGSARGLVLLSQLDDGGVSSEHPEVAPLSARTGWGWNEFMQKTSLVLSSERVAGEADFGLWAGERLRLGSRELAQAVESPVLDLAAEHLRRALAAVDEAGGVNVSEDVLDRLFARFCVGK